MSSPLSQTWELNSFYIIPFWEDGVKLLFSSVFSKAQQSLKVSLLGIFVYVAASFIKCGCYWFPLFVHRAKSNRSITINSNNRKNLQNLYRGYAWPNEYLAPVWTAEIWDHAVLVSRFHAAAIHTQMLKHSKEIEGTFRTAKSHASLVPAQKRASIIRMCISILRAAKKCQSL